MTHTHTYIRRRLATLLVLLFAALLLPAPSFAASDDAFTVPYGSTVPGDVATTTQAIVIDGDVAGDVTSWSGDITIRGHVGGDVVSYTGTVLLGPQAHVDGSVLSIGGGVERAATAQVVRAELVGAGSNSALSSIMGLFMPRITDVPAAPASGGRIIFGVMTGLFTLVFSLLWAMLWPNRTLAASLTLRSSPVRSLGVGLLSTLVLALVAVPLAGVLAASMVGLPVLLVLLVLVNAPYVYGLTTLARAFSLREPIAPRQPPGFGVIVSVAVVALVWALVGMVTPLSALALFYLMASPGLGAVILSRGGLIAPRTSLLA